MNSSQARLKRLCTHAVMSGSGWTCTWPKTVVVGSELSARPQQLALVWRQSCSSRGTRQVCCCNSNSCVPYEHMSIHACHMNTCAVAEPGQWIGAQGCSRPSTFGAAFLAFFAITTIVYCGGGALYGKKTGRGGRSGALGPLLSAHPHSSLWLQGGRTPPTHTQHGDIASLFASLSLFPRMLI